MSLLELQQHTREVFGDRCHSWQDARWRWLQCNGHLYYY